MSSEEIPNAQLDSYMINAAAHKPGIRNQEVVQYYNKWADKYDKDLNINVYRGPEIASSMCNIMVQDKKSNILDVGAGTGLVGLYLSKHGFECIDALEPSESMLAVAKEKNIYRNLYLEGIKQNEQTSLSENSYDACILSGSFGEGHIPTEGLRELIRLTRPNGIIIIVMRKEYLKIVKEYCNRLEDFMEKLELDRLWSRVTSFDVENYSFNKTGVVFVFKKN